MRLGVHGVFERSKEASRLNIAQDAGSKNFESLSITNLRQIVDEIRF
jgi:hypothetical protein